MKKSRRWLTLAASLLCGGTVFAAGLTSVTASADIVNGWDSGTPEGAAGNYGGVKGWAGGMTPGDMGDGFTRWVFINSHTIANNIALDVSKPITLTYSTKSNGSNQWMMFGLANSFDNAVKITTGMQESGNAAYRPFFFGHHADDNTDGANMFGEPVTWTAGAWDQVNDVCGADHWNGWTALEFTEVEIYFGEESASDGYILADGVYVGYPDAVQSDYESGSAYLVVSGFASSGVQIKVENTEKYTITANAENAAVVFDEIDALRRAGEGETISFTAMANDGYRITSVTAGADGKYSFAMPASDVTVTVATEAVYEVRYSGNAAVTFTGGTNVFAAGETVQFTVAPNDNYTVVSVSANGETLTADAEGKYSFVMPAADCEVVVSSEVVYTDPSEQTTESAVNGWNNEMYAEYPKYGPVVDAGGSSMVDEGNGYSNFVLTNGGSIGSVIPLDVTKPIYLDLLVKPNGPVPGTTPWFMIGLFDDWDVTVESGADAYGQNGGAGADLNERINYYKKLMFGFNYSDITSEDPIDFRSFGNVTDISLEGITNKFGDAWGWASGDHSVDYDYARFEIYIGETASEGYIKLDGVKIASVGVTQADFRDGTAYLHMLSFYSVRVQARIYAGAELDYTSEVDERAEIIFAEGTDLNALKTYDTVSFRVEVPEGYGAIVAVNGTELRADADGNYTAAIGYGTCTISVSVEQLVTVSFETNGGGTNSFTASFWAFWELDRNKYD